MDNIRLARRLLEPTDGAWQALLDHLTEDVVFSVTIPPGTPISGEIRGKQAVSLHFERLPGILEIQPEGPRQYFAHGDRVVTIGKETLRVTKSGETVKGSDFAEVLDFVDGRIARFHVIQDLSAVANAYRDD